MYFIYYKTRHFKFNIIKQLTDNAMITNYCQLTDQCQQYHNVVLPTF